MTVSAAQSAPLLLLPGLICTDLVWRAQSRSLAEFTVRAIPGYGDARSIVAMAERVLAQAPPEVSVAGHSMGARVALEMYRLAPDRIERLALLDTGVHPPAPGEADKRMALLELGRRNGMAALVDAWLTPMVHPCRRNDERFMAPLRRMCIEAGIGQFEGQVAALLGRRDLRPMLPSIDCPVLVGVGDADEWASVEQHREFAAAIPGAELAIFEGAGHMAPCEEPHQVTRALREWLGRAVLQ